MGSGSMYVQGSGCIHYLSNQTQKALSDSVGQSSGSLRLSQNEGYLQLYAY